MPTKSFRSSVRFLLPIVFLILFSFILNKAIISNPDSIRAWLDGFGIYAIAAYVVMQMAAIIIAPIGGSAFALAALALFGPLRGTVLIYLVTTPAYIINFLIARVYGRRVVRRLTGKDGEDVIDRFMVAITTRKLIVMKLFLGGYFDYISYAVGLTHVSLGDFIFINILGGIPAALFTWSIMQFAPNFLSAVAIFYTVPAIFGVLYLSYSRMKRKKPEEFEKLLEHEI